MDCLKIPDLYDNKLNITDNQCLSAIHDLCKVDNGKISVGVFLDELQRRGIQPTDKRLTTTIRLLNKMRPHGLTLDRLNLDPCIFHDIVSDNNTILINKAFQDQLIIPNFQEFCSNIEDIFHKCKQIKNGQTSEYLPQLKEADPDKWGMAICTTDGQRFALGDHTHPFTVHSLINLLTHAASVDKLGADIVYRFQGREPSGRSFNEIALDHQSKSFLILNNAKFHTISCFR